MMAPTPPPTIPSRVALGLLASAERVAAMTLDPTIGRLIPVHSPGYAGEGVDVYPDAEPIYPESLAAGFAETAAAATERIAGWLLSTCATGTHDEIDAWVGVPDPRRRRRLAPGTLAPIMLMFTPGGLASSPAVVWRLGFGGPTDYLRDGEMVLADRSIRWCAHRPPSDTIPPGMRAAAVAARR